MERAMGNTLTLLTHILFTIVGMEEPTSKTANQIWSLTKNAAAVTILQTPIDNFCNGKSNGQYTNPADTYSFHNCWDGRTYLQNCPSNLVFKQKRSCCDYPTINTSTPIDNFCDGKKGNFPYPGDKHSLYTWQRHHKKYLSILVFKNNAYAVNNCGQE